MADLSKQLTRRLVKLSLGALPARLGVPVAHRLRAREEQRRARAAHGVVLSHAKSGRTWLRAMLSRLFQQRYGMPEGELLEFDNWHRREPRVPRLLFTHGHYLAGLYAGAPPARTVFLHRHPCDIAVSQYFHFAKRTKGYKKELHGVEGAESASMFEFVTRSELGLPEIIAYLNAWQERLAHRPDALLVGYEDMRAQPQKLLTQVSGFLGLDFGEDELAGAVAFAAFDNLKELERTGYFRGGRLRPGDPEDADSYKVRRGKVGGYRDYFSDEQCARLDRMVRDELSPQFGYGS